MSAKYRRLFERYIRIYSFALYFGVAIIVVGVNVGTLLYDVAGLIVAVGSVIVGARLAATAYYARNALPAS